MVLPGKADSTFELIVTCMIDITNMFTYLRPAYVSKLIDIMTCMKYSLMKLTPGVGLLRDKINVLAFNSPYSSRPMSFPTRTL